MARTPGSLSTTRTREDEGQARCWRVMRYLSRQGGGFTFPQLCMAADVTLNAARHYVKALERSGHVTKIRENESGRTGSYACWRVTRDTGSDAPILHRNRQGVYDPNTKTHHGGTDDLTA